MALSTGNAMTKIALVEDNPDNRMLVHAILDDVFDIVDYENGVDALAGITANRPDVVLLDISLPQMDGTEVLRRIRADSELSDLPVVALTAHAMAGDREKYLGLGFDDYVTKPILDEAVLVAAIAELLKRHGG
jgi:CheY-like chemotaxis protein